MLSVMSVRWVLVLSVRWVLIVLSVRWVFGVECEMRQRLHVRWVISCEMGDRSLCIREGEIEREREIGRGGREGGRC